MKLLLYIAYDGSHFCGYQAQARGCTVQQTLNAATEELFGYPCDITGCSRTDSGVHARMFCAAVTKRGSDELSTTIPLSRIPRALNIRLPDAVAVWCACMVPSDFHPRYDVSSKAYEYRIYPVAERDPLEMGRCWQVPCDIDDERLAAMEAAAKQFVGTRDFRACMAAGSTVENTVRTVMSADVTREGRMVVFRVRADGFLYHMVRIMAGTLLDVAYGKIEPEEISDRLASLNRGRMGRTAPPEGLYLDRVFYQDPDRAGYHEGGDADEP